MTKSPHAAVKPTGRIVTFYSYKGGTGRSMSLANIAWILANKGLRVLVIDWDLEAPGLHRYFGPFLRDKSLSSSEGIIDFIIDFSSAAVSRPSSEDPPSGEPWYRSYTNLLRYAISLEWPHFQTPGTLDFVCAGRQDEGYALRVNSFQWQHFYEKLGGGIFLEEVKQRLRDEYDYILIDSRTGVSDTSGICTVQMPDDLIVCFTLNQQSIEGAAASAQSALRQRRRSDGSPGLRVLPVITRIDSSEKEKLDIARAAARQYFDPLLEAFDEESLGEYWGSVQIPYVPFYAYEEVLAVFGDAPLQHGTVLAAFESVTGWLTYSNTTTKTESIPESLRVQTLQRFLRQKQTPGGQLDHYLFYVSYARSDFNEAVYRFFTDLVAAFESIADIPQGAIGFLDRSRLWPGESFGEQITAAVASSRSAVCLLTHAYIGSQYCLSELRLFQDAGKPVFPIALSAMLDRSEIVADAPPASVPNLLQPTLQVPPINGSTRDAYYEAVNNLASQIANAVLPREKLGKQPPVVEIPVTVVAERRDAVRFLRSDLHAYGLRRRDWWPFASVEEKSVAEYVRRAAEPLGVKFKVLTLTAAENWLRHDRGPDEQKLLIIVDAWSFLLPKRRAFLFGLTQSEVSATIIVCFDSDAETAAREEELQKLSWQTGSLLLGSSEAKIQVLVAANPAEFSSALNNFFQSPPA